MQISYIYRCLIGAIVILLSACQPSKKLEHNTNLILVTPLSANGIVLPVIIKNKRYSFLLDTGASYSAIDNKLALLLTLATPREDIPLYFHQFLTDGFMTTNDKLNNFKLWRPLPIEIGTYTILGHDPWIGVDLTLISQAFGQKIDGILGVEVFRQLNWAINNKAKTVTIWKQLPSKINYQNCVPYEDAYAQSPFLILNNENTAYRWDSASLSVDTGTDDTLISKELLSFWKDSKMCKLTLDQKNIVRSSANGLSTNETYLIDCLFFDQMRVGNFKIQVTKNNINKLGFDFFSRFDNYIFIPSKMQFCYNATKFTQNDKKFLRYFSLGYINNHFVFRYNNPANIAPYQLLNGDILLQINNINVNNLDIKKIRELLNVTPSNKLSLLILRDKNKIKLQI
jgi:hypothetical protein